MAKGKSNRRKGDDSDEDVPAPAPPKESKKGKRDRGDSDDLPPPASNVSKASNANKKGKRRGDDDEDEEDAEESKNNSAAAPADGALSKTAAKKAKRDAKKQKAGVAAPAASASSAKSRRNRDDEEEEDNDSEQDEPAFSSKAKKDEEEDDEEVDEAAENLDGLELSEAVGGAGDSDEEAREARVRKADKKHSKRAKEQKQRERRAHGVIDPEDLPPTPPPQPPPLPTPEPSPSPNLEEEMEVIEEPAPAAEEEEEEEEAVVEEVKPKARKPNYGNDDDGEEVDAPPAEETLVLKDKKKKDKRAEKKKKLLGFELEATAAARARPPDNKVFAVSATSVDVNDENWKKALDIVIPAFTISTHGKTLFSDAKLTIAHGRRYGLVGPNGLGKSVLLRAIANRDLPIPPTIDALYVEQEVLADETPAIDVVLAADTRRTFLLKREEELLKLVEDAGDDGPDDATHEELLQVTEELRVSGADAAEAKALNLLRGLGFTEQMARQPTQQLSGGWRMRVSIARGLFLAPTLLLMDEPTNHLDLEAVIFLESVLSKWEKTLVVVSHDQDFLDSVVQEIIYLKDQKLGYAPGDFTNYDKVRKSQFIASVKEFEKQMKLLKSQRGQKTTKEKAADALKASKRGKGQEDQALAARGAKNTGAITLKSRPPREYSVNFEFPDPPPLKGTTLITINIQNFAYPGGPILFRHVDFGLHLGDEEYDDGASQASRINLSGPNGSGKSTLIGMITQAITPTHGEVVVRNGVKIASYKQHFVDALPLGQTPVDYLKWKHNVPEEKVRAALGNFGLKGEAHLINMASLSGGQKARVVFADMAFQDAHVLVLDEPSNNLDMESIRALGEAIKEFRGAVVLVSHDARLIEETGMALYVVEDQTVVEYTGGIDDYRRRLLERLEREEQEASERLAQKQLLRAEEKKKKLEEVDAKVKRRAAAKKAAAGGEA